MGTFYTGATGSLYVDGQRVAKVTNWSLNGTAEPLETTNTGDTAKTYVYGLQAYAGSCSAIYWENDSGAVAMSKLLESIYRTNGVNPTQTCSLQLRAANNRKLAADVLFTSAAAAVATNTPTVVQMNFTVTGHLTDVSFAG